jgi:hypothetical protein
MHPNDLIAMLINHASTDQTRYRLWGIHCDKESGDFIATDGHRLLKVSADKMPARWARGLTYEPKPFKDWHAVEIKDCVYPAWQSIMPDKSKATHIFKTVIPQWMGRVKALKVRDSKEGCYIGIDETGQFTMGRSLCYFDIVYLGAYAGHHVEIRLDMKDKNIGPALITPTEKEAGWTAVVMPMRCNPWPVEIIDRGCEIEKD